MDLFCGILCDWAVKHMDESFSSDADKKSLWKLGQKQVTRWYLLHWKWECRTICRSWRMVTIKLGIGQGLNLTGQTRLVMFRRKASASHKKRVPVASSCRILKWLDKYLHTKQYVCLSIKLSIYICFYLSIYLFINIYHYLSLFITIYSITIYHYLSLFITIYHYLYIYMSINQSMNEWLTDWMNEWMNQ